MPATWFARLELLHETRGRARFRYRCRPGMPSDAHQITRALETLSGIETVRVNANARSISITFDRQRTDAKSLADGILDLTPDVYPDSANTHAGHHDDDASLGAVAASGGALLVSRALLTSLQAPVAFGSAIPLMGKAVEDLFGRGITSHVLEAIAVAISIGRRDFLTANVTSFLLALGDYLEHSIERRSDDLLKHLLKPATSEIWVERDGTEVLIPAGDVAVGDTVIVATGAVIPVDGTVLGGEASVNEATMTGESVPVVRKRGDTVLSGTLVDEGRIRIYAERVGRNSAAARIADFVQQSLAVKSRTQLEAARMADRLVPIVLGLAGSTWLLSQDSRRAAAVLQADYSCVLKLSTPVAFKAAMYQGGKSGILIKGASALERLAEADTFIFDKTGTLTTGKLEVTDSVSFKAGYNSDDIINIAASVEEHYAHPLAMAVVEASRRLDNPKHFQHKEVRFVVAHGVASVIDGKRIVVGSRHFIEEDENISLAANRAAIEKLEQEGKTLLYIGFGGELLGVLALRDTVRANTAATLARLRELGAKRILMLTGDHPDRARAMAEQLGIDEFHAGLLPHDKAAILQKLTKSGAKIAFVGDGVNDAPALTGASVGISMHEASDIARLASDVALLEDNIARVADAKELANATKRLIDSNFKLIAGVNSSILLAAASGILNPVASSAMHNGSTIGILLRALVGAGLPRKRAPRAASLMKGLAA